MPHDVKDASCKLTRALPASNTTVTTATSLETGKVTAAGHTPGTVEYLLTAPALTVGQLANASTMTYNIIVSANSNLSSPTTLIAGAIVQTGAGGAGAAGNTYRFRLPSNTSAYVGFTATNSAAADASAASATLEQLF